MRQFWAGVGAGLALWSSASGAATVERFVPQGEVRSVRQLQARFSEDMVRFGDATQPSPFDVACPVPGKGRWIDARNWVYDLEADAPPGVKCSFTPMAALRTLGGGAITGKPSFSFSTGGPAVLQSEPYAGGSLIDEEQIFILKLNGAAETATVLQNAWCVVEGLGDRVPVKVVAGEARAALFKALRRDKEAADDKLLLLQCGQRLPAGANVTLVWGRGIAAARAKQGSERIVTTVDQPLRYKVRPEFRVSFTCVRENAQAPCSPYQGMALEFTSPVSRDLAAAIRLKAGAAERKPAWNRNDTENLVNRVVFEAPFPESAELTLTLPPGFVDDSGRNPANAGSFPMRGRTGEGPPLVKFAAGFGIIELKDAVLPVTVRNVEPAIKQASASIGAASPPTSAAPAPAAGTPMARMRVEADALILEWLLKLRRAGNDEYKSREVALVKGRPEAKAATVPAPAGGKAFEVIGIPLPEPGFHVVELESERLGAALLGKPKPMYVRTGALVTNMAVHFKSGRESGAVWVTALDTAQPVAEAAIRVSDCAGREVWRGSTGADGVARIPQGLQRGAKCADEAPAFFVSARKGRDLSFALSDWQNGIEPWRFNVQQGYGGEEAVVAHTVFDRPLFRAGETVSMKHFVRMETLAGLAAVARAPAGVRISHAASGTDVELPVDFSPRGTAHGTWKIPADAKLGEYDVSLLLPVEGKGPAGPRVLSSGSFRVGEFRLPLMQGAVVAPKAAQVGVRELPLDLSLGYLAGGPAAGHAVRITALTRERYASFAGYEAFRFGVDDEPEADGSEARGNDRAERLVADKQAVTLGRDGTAKFVIKDLPKSPRPRELVAEMQYRDPNGEEQTLRTVVPVWPAAVVAGIQTDSWVQVSKNAGLKVVVLGMDGKPRGDAPVKVTARLVSTLSTRKRTVGGFYAYENRTERRDLGTLCSGKSDARGLFLCDARLAEPGNVELEASAEDGNGRASRAMTSLWVAGAEMWFGGANADRMDLLPEKRRYEPGETARLQVRMPFRAATAWVAVEREGVIETRVLPVTGKNPVIEVPVKAGFAPNVYVSVLAVRGRVRDVPWTSFFSWGWRSPFEWWSERREWVEQFNRGEPTALVDLARPAFKLGVAELEVGRAAYELKVAVTTDKAVYQTRETARVRVVVQGPEGKPVPAGTEVALAAVDESLLELMPNQSWDVLSNMVRKRSYYVETSTAQMQVVGRRHFGKKALPPGGGGGRAPTRELFDTLLAWHPALAVGPNGEVLVDVPLNDALTSFRIVAIADAQGAGPGALFGTGSTTVRATRDLQVLAGLPPLVREGDRFAAGVTLRNTTTRAMRVAVTARAEGLPALAVQEVNLAAGAAQEVRWPVTVPSDRSVLAWTVAGEEKGAAKPARDALKVAQRVAPAVPLTVQQATLVQVDRAFTLPVAPPAAALKDAKGVARGGLSVALSPRLAGAQEGVRRYFAEYPFSCLEQKTSKAIGLKDKAQWQALAAQVGNYLDSDGLAGYFPGGRGSDTLTAYVLAVAHESGFALPEGVKERMEAGLIAFVEGRIQREGWSPVRDLEARRLAAIEALARTGKAVPRMLDAITLTPNAWPTHAVIDWVSILSRMPQIAKRDEQLAAAEQVLRGRLTMSGTRMVFSTENEDRWWWLMAGGDVNAARLIAVLADKPNWREDMPRLVAGLVARQQRGAWETTTANLWGTLALDKFGARFESASVAGSTRAGYEGTTPASSLNWGTQAQGGALALPWPAAGATLKLVHEGGGKPWAAISSTAAVPLREAVSAGYRITRTVMAVEQKTAGTWTRGDVLRVRVEVDAQADMTWVVVADPVPAGATVLGSGMARDSQVAQAGQRGPTGAWPAFEERAQEAFRAYYDYAPKGKWSVEYTLRLNQDGEFNLPPTRVEAMYAPDVNGMLPNAPMKVAP
jgi:uncharacterized protein YfaS (alpha-2-macroglobulin family)